MPSKLDAMAEELARLNLQIKHDMEQAEAKVAKVNHLIKELGATGLLNEFVVFGRTRTREYAPEEGNDGSTYCVIKAALLIPDGFGICGWPSDEAYDLECSPSGFKPEAKMRFVPFSKCSSADKAFLLPEIDELLEELVDVAQVAAAEMEKGPRLTAEEYFAKRWGGSRRGRRKK